MPCPANELGAVAPFTRGFSSVGFSLRHRLLHATSREKRGTAGVVVSNLASYKSKNAIAHPPSTTDPDVFSRGRRLKPTLLKSVVARSRLPLPNKSSPHAKNDLDRCARSYGFSIHIGGGLEFPALHGVDRVLIKLRTQFFCHGDIARAPTTVDYGHQQHRALWLPVQLVGLKTRIRTIHAAGIEIPPTPAVNIPSPGPRDSSGFVRCAFISSVIASFTIRSLGTPESAAPSSSPIPFSAGL